MEERLRLLLDELERLGEDNDVRVTSRPDRLLNITPDTGSFLSLLIQAVRARRIVEIGTSNGYSTLWLAHAAVASGGTVMTVERNPAKARMAAANFERSGLAGRITLHEGEAGAFLAAQAAASVDFLFLDAERVEYPGFWPDIRRLLVPGGLVVADNATSHPAEMAPFRQLVDTTPGYLTSLVPVGKGELLILKQAGSEESRSKNSAEA